MNEFSEMAAEARRKRDAELADQQRQCDDRYAASKRAFREGVERLQQQILPLIDEVGTGMLQENIDVVTNNNWSSADPAHTPFVKVGLSQRVSSVRTSQQSDNVTIEVRVSSDGFEFTVRCPEDYGHAHVSRGTKPREMMKGAVKRAIESVFRTPRGNS